MEDFVDELMKIVDELKGKGLILSDQGIMHQRAVKKNGYITPCISFTRAEIETRAKNISDACKIIPFLVLKTTRKGLTNSYGLKHLVEKHLESQYLSNGELILGMMLLKYKFHVPNDGSSVNCTFNCTLVRNDAFYDALQKHCILPF